MRLPSCEDHMMRSRDDDMLVVIEDFNECLLEVFNSFEHPLRVLTKLHSVMETAQEFHRSLSFIEVSKGGGITPMVLTA